jgi:DNA-binding transcriptional ArsR family regulator
MPHPTADIGSFLHAVADPTRRRILEAMKEHARSATEKNGLCAGEIEERVKLSQPTVSHHMKILEKAGLVEVRKEGTWRRYRRDEKLFAESIRALKKQL